MHGLFADLDSSDRVVVLAFIVFFHVGSDVRSRSVP